MAGAAGDAEDFDRFVRFRDDGQDEVDSSKVLQVLRDADIPNKCYHVGGTSDRRVRELAEYPVFVDPDWGLAVTQQPVWHSVCILLQMNRPLVDKADVEKVTSSVGKKAEALSLRPLRWKDSSILIDLGTQDNYLNLADAFMCGILEDCDGNKVMQIDGVQADYFPLAFIEVTSNDVSQVTNAFTQAILPFSAMFPFLLLRESATSSALTVPEEGLPSLVFHIQFVGQHQNLALRMLEVLGKSPWQEVKLPERVIETFMNGTRYFTCELGGPGLAVSTGCAQSGVQLEVLVGDSLNLGKMKEFYGCMLQKSCIEGSQGEGAVQQVVYPMSRKMELALKHYQGVKISTVASMCINVQVSEQVLDVLGTTMSSNNPYSHGLNDPAGNDVRLVQVLK